MTRPSHLRAVVAVLAAAGKYAAKAALVLALFALLVVAVALSSMNLRVVKQEIAKRVTALLAPELGGTITIESIGRIDPFGVSGVRARLRDPTGRSILFADGVAGRLDTVRLLRSLFRSGPIEIGISRASVAYADLSLDADARGDLRLVAAVEPRRKPATTPGAPHGGVRLSIAEGTLAHAWVHGLPPGGPPLDVEVRDAAASVDLRPGRIEIVGTHASLASRGMPVGADPRGAVAGRLVLGTESGLALDGRFRGDVGGLSTTATARFEAGRLDAAVVASASAGARRTLLPEVRLAAPLDLRASASGALRALAVRATGTLERGRVDVTGELSLTPLVRATATVHVAHLDLRDVDPRAPQSDVSGLVRAALVVRNGEPSGEVHVTSEPSRVASVALPRVTADGTLANHQLMGRVVADEDGARASALVCLRKARGELLLDFDATATSTDLGSLPRARGVVTGQGRVALDGTLSIDSLRGSAHLTASASTLAFDGIRVGEATVDARVGGLVANPMIDATALVKHVVGGGMEVRTASAHARGTLTRSLVEFTAVGGGHGPSLDGSARVEIGDFVTLADLSATGSRDGVAAAIDARVVRIAPHDLRLEGGILRGVGEPVRLDARLASHELRLRLAAPRLDLRRVATLAGLPARSFHGSVAADLDLVAHPSGATGRAKVELTDAAFGDGSRGEGTLDAHVEKDRIVLSFDGAWSGSHVALHTDGLRLGGPPTELRSWGRAFGGVGLDADVDLGRIRQIAPDGWLPFEARSGRIEVALRLSRKVPGAMPEATLSLRTSGLALARKGAPLEPSDGTAVRSQASWLLSGVDLDVDAATDEDGDEATLHVRAEDGHGVVADVTFASPFPPAAVLTDPARLRTFLQTSPLHAKLSFPRRKLSDLPGVLRTTMGGNIALTAEAKGTLRAPDVEVVLDLDDWRRQPHAHVPAVGAHVTGHYDGRRGNVDVTATSGGKEALVASAIGHVAVGDLLARRADAPWDASAHATLEHLPLEAVPGLAEQRLRGSVTGDADLALGTATPPRLHAKIDVNPLTIGKSRGNRASAEIDVGEDTLAGTARLDQPDGFLVAKTEIGVVWPMLAARVGTVVPTARPAHLDVQAKNFRLAALRPFVQDQVARLDGRADANVQIDVSEHGGTTATRGHVTVRDGVFELPDLGEEFQQVRATARFDPDGVVVVDDVSARGTSGSVSGNAVVRLRGLGLLRAEGDFRVPKGESFPIAVQGQLLADAWGSFHAEVARSEGAGLGVKIDVSEAGVKLPERTTHSLQSLEPAPRVRVGVHRSPGQFELLPQGPVVTRDTTASADTRIDVHLGRVEVRRGNDLRVVLEGNPVVRMGHDEGVTGTIVLREGFLEVQGKRFEIESGTITFVGQADNPEVVVTAGWTAPEGSRVYADFVGPLKTGKVTLRSEPAHTNSEILSLILFGTTSGSSAPMASGTTGAGEGAEAAAGLGGGFATQGLNRALDDLTGLDLTARVDTSDSANPRPELEVRIARDISVSLAHVLGVPPPGANPDRNLATIDWRFLRNWSLESTFGDAGSSTLDFVWQYRY